MSDVSRRHGGNPEHTVDVSYSLADLAESARRKVYEWMKANRPEHVLVRRRREIADGSYIVSDAEFMVPGSWISAALRSRLH